MPVVTGFRSSPQQAAWWGLDEHGRAAAVSRLQCRLMAALDLETLTERLQVLMASEEILRTRLQALAAMEWPVQVIDEPGIPPLQVEDCRGENAQAQQARLDALLEAPLSLPWQVEVTRLSDAEYVLTLGAAVSVLDTASLRLLAAYLMTGKREPSSLQYADYAEWKLSLLEAGPEHPGVRYWQALRAQPVAALATGLERQAIASLFRAGAAEIVLPTAVVADLQTLATANGYGLEDLLLGAWLAWLARLSGQPAVETALLDSGRGEGLESALGAYEQALPVRTSIDLANPLAAQLRHWIAAKDQALGWQDYYDSRHALDYAFAYRPAAALPAAVLHESGLGRGYKLRLDCVAAGDSLRCRFSYDRAWFEPAAIDCAIEQWQALLQGLLRAPDRPIGRLALLGERQRAISEPAGVAPSLRSASIVELIEEHARDCPLAPAVVDAHGRLSYGELNRRANQLAQRLQQAGVAVGESVGILLPRGQAAIVAILATLKAGAAYVPLDPSYPTDRLRYMLSDAGMRLVIGESGDLAAAAGVATIDPDAADLASLPHENPRLALDPQQPAYLIYTSGSTGQPKAVEISHGNLSHSTQVRMAFYGEPVRAYLLLSSLAFDSSVAGLFWTLAQGGLLVLPATGEELALDQLTRLIRRHGVSHALSLPSLYEALLDYATPDDLAGLRTWIVAGESCKAALVAKHRQALPAAALMNEYGPTEATVWATVERLDTAAEVTIGRPIPTMDLWLLNEQGEPAGVGEPGEIYLGGPQLARGYRNRPQQTTAAFQVHAVLPGAPRLYRTGDLACRQPDGRLRFLGRRDHQIKIRGFRVELGEIERVLQAHSEVAAAVVIAQPWHDSHRLLAYVVARQDARCEAEALRDYLGQRLPDYMVPAACVRLDALPRSPNGKVDLQALPDPAQVSEQPHVAPQNAMESALQEIYAEVLRRADVGVLDDFFRIGGDSILSLQLVARALQRGIHITAKQIFERRTIAALAEVAQWVQASEAAASTNERTPPALDADALTDLLSELADAQ